MKKEHLQLSRKELIIELERLFAVEKYEEITALWDIYKHDLNSVDEAIKLLEILSVSYLETDNFSKSLYYINMVINHFYNGFINKTLSIEDEYDLKMFVLTMLEVLQRTGGFIKEYKVFQRFERLFREETEFANRIKDLEDIIDDYFMKYYKYVGYLLFGVVLISFLSLTFRGSSIFPRLLSIASTTYIVILLFRKKIREIIFSLSTRS